MDIIFDDSFKFLSNFQKHEDEVPIRISSLGSIITERNIRLAAVDPKVQSEFQRYKTVNKADRRRIVQDILSGPYVDADKDWFIEQVEMLNRGSGSSGGWNEQNDDIQGTIIQESNVVGEAGMEAGTALQLKEAVIARLRMRGVSDQEINDILVLFMEKVMLPFSETIKILDYCLEESLKARVNATDLIEFFAYHYDEKRSFTLTKSIVDQAVKLQEINPSLNIFNLLKNAAIGNQTEVSKVILIKDPDARLVVNNLISLSQSALPEQAEQVRRNFQFSRDALLNYQEKLKIQKSLVDMMMSEGMNKGLTSQIANMSAIFKMLMTQPLFRGLKQVYYDVNAAKMVLNTLGSMVVDTQPLSPRVSPREEQVMPQSGMYPYQAGNSRISSTNRFVPLKKNSLVTAQTLITNPTAQPGAVSNPSPNLNPITGTSSATGLPTAPQAGTFGSPSQPADSAEQRKATAQLLAYTSREMQDVADQIVNKVKVLGPHAEFIAKLIATAILKIVDFFKRGGTNFFEVIEQVFQELIQSIKDNGNKISQLVTNWFNNLNKVKPPDKPSNLDPGTAEAQPLASSFDRNIKLAQYNQQIGNESYNAQKISAVLGTILTAVVAFFGSRGLVQALTKVGVPATNNPFGRMAVSNLISDIINLIMPLAELIKSSLLEIFNEIFPGVMSNYAPTSSQYYHRGTRRFSEEGKRRLYNHQQVRLSLGISNQEDLALARAQKQRVENMTTVRTQTDILQKAMDQNVYLGGKSDVAPGLIPLDLQNKINIFLKFVKSVQDACQAEYLIMKKAVDRASGKLDGIQKIQAQNVLSEIRNDMSVLQSLISEYSSSALVLDHIQRKRMLMMTVGPTLKKLQALESLGISKAALITGKNGVLQQLSRIRHEEGSALQKLRKEYMEKIQLLNRPDIAQKEFAFPVDTRATALPVPPLPPTVPTGV